MKNMNTASKISPAPKSKVRMAWAGRAGLFLISFILMTLVLFLERDQSIGGREFKIGEPAARTLFSPFDLAFENEQATAELRQRTLKNVPAVYVINPAVWEQTITRVDRFFSLLNEARNAQDVQTERIDRKALLETLPFEVSENSVKALLDENDLAEPRHGLQLLFEKSLRNGVLDHNVKLGLLESGVMKINIMDASLKRESTVSVRDIPSLGEIVGEAQDILPDPIYKKRNLRSAVLDIFNAVAIPNLELDEMQTEIRKMTVSEAIEPVADHIKKNELIIQRGMLVTAVEKQKITHIQKKMAERQVLKRLSALALLVFVVYTLCFVYLLYFERKTLMSMRMMILMHTIFLITVLVSKVIVMWPGSSPYLMPTALASLLLVMLINVRMGLLGAVVMGVLAAPLCGLQADVMAGTFLMSLAGSFLAYRVRRRVQFLRVGVILGVVYFSVIFAFQIYQEYTLFEAIRKSVLGLILNGMLITTPILFLSLAILEQVFDLVTDITLLELSDLNHPLLKRMIIEAPGTYHHSLVVSRLAEQACETIGANELLARVGCYFHDIGKIAKSEFFTENQSGRFAVNKHDKLTPSMSCLVIINHVKDGIELGKKYKLRGRILDFIPEHQGTGVVYYFYRKALDDAQPGETVDPNDYRYPGPNPQSRETAVSLLADSVEAASRSLDEPSPESIRQLVRKIINDKFIDGQLDECDLTLKDLLKIQESFIHNLIAIYHSRVKYPVTPKDPQKPDIFQGGQFEKYR